MKRAFLTTTLLFGTTLLGAPTIVGAQTPVAVAGPATNNMSSSATVAAPPVNIAAGTINITGGAITLTTPPAAAPNADEAFTPQGCQHPLMRCFNATSGTTTTFAVVAPDDRTTFHLTATEANMAATRIVMSLSDHVFTNRIRQLQADLAAARKERDDARIQLAAVMRAATTPPALQR